MSSASSGRYFEDLAVGQTFHSTESLTVTAASIKAFAADFDPQPFHLDETAAKATFFGGLAASGWHTAAMTMRLLVESTLKPAGGTIGAGGEGLKWPRATRPGDVLRAEIEILELRPSQSRPELGVVKIRLVTLNQVNEPVQICLPVLMVPRRGGFTAAGDSPPPTS
jgi:acyl dehydratase